MTVEETSLFFVAKLFILYKLCDAGRFAIGPLEYVSRVVVGVGEDNLYWSKSAINNR